MDLPNEDGGFSHHFVGLRVTLTEKQWNGLQPSRDIVCWSINQEGASKISKVEPEKIGKTWGNHGKNMGKIMKYLVGGFEPVEPSEK